MFNVQHVRTSIPVLPVFADARNNIT